MKLPNISPQEIVLNPSCSKQAHSNRLGTSHNYENMEPVCMMMIMMIFYSWLVTLLSNMQCIMKHEKEM